MSMTLISSEIVKDYDKICNNVKDLDAKIRFAGIINDRGRLVSGGMRQGIEPLEKEKDDEILFMELALRVKMRQEFDKQLGAVNFAMALREKSLEISVPVDRKGHVLYVVAEPDTDYTKIPKKILDMIR